MPYSKRRKNLRGGQRKRSNRKSYKSSMSGGSKSVEIVHPLARIKPLFDNLEKTKNDLEKAKNALNDALENAHWQNPYRSLYTPSIKQSDIDNMPNVKAAKKAVAAAQLQLNEIQASIVSSRAHHSSTPDTSITVSRVHKGNTLEAAKAHMAEINAAHYARFIAEHGAVAKTHTGNK